MFLMVAGVLLAGCADERADTGSTASAIVEPTPSEPGPVSPIMVETDTLTEVLRPCGAVQPIRAYQYLCLEESVVSWVDETAGATEILFGVEQVAGAPHGEDVLLVADGVPYVLDGTVLRDVSWSIPVPVDQLVSHGDDTWMLGAGRLFVLSEGSVTELNVDGVAHIYDFAVSNDTLFIGAPEWMAIDRADLSAGVTAMGDVPVDAMATDALGALWWVTDGRVFHRSAAGLEQEIALPETINDVVGPGIWLVGEANAYRVSGSSMEVHALVATGVVGVDTYGRLIRQQDGQVFRHSTGRPVVVTGLSNSLMVAETLTLLPSDPDSVQTLSAWVNDQPLYVQGPPYQVTINPEYLVDGAHDLRFFTTSTKGDHMATHPIWVGSLPEVEWTEIQAISQAHCDRCHGGDTLTDLTTSLGWEQRIDEIIMLVSTEQMPLGGPYLSDEEIVLIRAWKHGGFE